MNENTKQYLLIMLEQRMDSIIEGWEYEEQGEDYEQAHTAYNAIKNTKVHGELC